MRTDVVLAAAIGAFAVLDLAAKLDLDPSAAVHPRADNAALWLLTLPIPVCLAWRRRAPVVAFAMACALTLALDVLRFRAGFAFVIVCLLCYAVGAYSRGRATWWAPALSAMLLVSSAIAHRSHLAVNDLVDTALVLLVAWVLGRLVESRRREQRRLTAAVRAQAEAAAQQASLMVAAERLRIAQELHDVVAHSISVVAVQAGVGEHLISSQPHEAARALAAIADTSRATLNELRRLLGGLETQPAEGATPTLADIGALVERVRAVGVQVDLRRDGDVDDVPAGVGLAFYRIAQESLTNVLKHAGAASVEVVVHVDDDGARLTVIDDGRGASVPAIAGSGNGLRGMRERVAIYGGRLVAHPRPGGGFVVEARVPLGVDPVDASEVASAPDTVTSCAPIGLTTDSARVPRASWRQRVAGWLRRRPDTTDAILMVATMIFAFVQLAHVSDRPLPGRHFRPTSVITWLLTIAVCVPLLWRRRRPALGLAVCLGALFALAVSDYHVGLAPVVALLFLYGAGAYCELPVALVCLVAAEVAVAVAVLTRLPDLDGRGGIAQGFFFAMSVLAGLLIRSRRVGLELEYDEEAARAAAATRRAAIEVSNERLEIARELHDVVAHSVSLIAVQAGVGGHLLESRPDEARHALATISHISRSTLRELRRILGVLRENDGRRSYAPAPGLAELPSLLETVRRSGVAVEYTVDGLREPIPAGVDLSAYRVVQEALTNVVRHAGPATARVRISYEPGAVDVEVVDDGRGASATVPDGETGGVGRGLAVMRERVRAYGGRLRLGPRPGGGYQVSARLPFASLEEVAP